MVGRKIWEEYAFAQVKIILLQHAILELQKNCSTFDDHATAWGRSAQSCCEES